MRASIVVEVTGVCVCVWEVDTGRGRSKKCTAATERDDDDDEGGIAVGVGVGVGVGGVHRASSSSVVSRVRVDVATHDEARGARRHG